ncbi:hypothetical protein F030043B2_23140 [Bacteroides fragilis]
MESLFHWQPYKHLMALERWLSKQKAQLYRLEWDAAWIAVPAPAHYDQTEKEKGSLLRTLE